MKDVILGQDAFVRKFVSLQLGIPVSTDGVGIGLVERGSSGFCPIIAGVLFDQYNGASICMHVAAVAGKRWMTREYLRVCFAYPFKQLKVKKIVGLVGSGNLIAQRFDENLGFRLEATLTDAHPDGNLLVYTMTKEDCRWLNIPPREARNGKSLCTPAT